MTKTYITRIISVIVACVLFYTYMWGVNKAAEYVFSNKVLEMISVFGFWAIGMYLLFELIQYVKPKIKGL